MQFRMGRRKNKKIKKITRILQCFGKVKANREFITKIAIKYTVYFLVVLEIDIVSHGKVGFHEHSDGIMRHK